MSAEVDANKLRLAAQRERERGGGDGAVKGDALGVKTGVYGSKR